MIRIKVFTGIALLLFGVTVASLLTAAYVERSSQSKATHTANETEVLSNYLTLDEVGKHQTRTDCWIIIEGSVYDVSGFIEQHPGGAESMIPYCGKDGTVAFQTKDKTRPQDHSTSAKNMLKDYFIGKLGQELAIQNVPTTKIASATPTLETTKAIVNNNSLTLTTAEIAKHSTTSNCWIIISGKVYDVTKYLVQHPGGVASITPSCGKDATQAFASRGGTGTHSSTANMLLSNFLIGTVGQNINVAPQQTTTITIPSPTPIRTIPVNAQLSLTTGEVSSHNTLSNCWIIISGNVYDVTSYITNHPGGVSTIQGQCGKDGTSAFQTKGGKGSNHSNNAYSLLNQYLIGSIGSTIPVNPTQAPTNNTPHELFYPAPLSQKPSSQMPS
jgi:cytochrome b involved in lipid metabolism